MTECMSIGSAAKLAVQGGNTPRTFDASSERYDFLYETLTYKQRRVGNRTIKGDLSDWKERNVQGASLVSGVIAFQASPSWFNAWQTRIIGDVDSSTTNDDGDTIYWPGTSLPSFDVMINREAKTFHYKECYVNRCIIRGQSAVSEEEPEILDVVVQLIGKSVDDAATWPATEPDLGVTENDLPYVIGLSTLNAASASREYDSFVFSIDHGLITKFRNSLTLSCIRPGSRKVRLQTNNPFLATSYGALHNTLASPISGVLTFNRGDAYTELKFATLDNMGEDPNVRGKTEIPHSLDFQALKDGENDIPEVGISTHLIA